MKKRLLCFLIAVLCVLPLALTGCGEGEPVTETGTKPLTLTLYGITGKTTTEEAIKAVEEELNVYTEGKFNTHIVLKLYPEDEYYKIIDEKLADIERIKKEEEAAAKKKKEEDRLHAQMGQTRAPESSSAETEAETYEENGATKVVYPAVKDTQLDIFMVQGAANLNKYHSAGYLSPLSESLANTAKLIGKYISAERMATGMLEGRGNASGLVDRGTSYGIPNNTVVGEYTYLLVNKELATKYYYSANDVKTLVSLSNFLDDAATNHPDYITLYNEPTITLEYLTEEPSLIGGVLTNSSFGFSRLVPRDMLNVSSYTNYLSNVYEFRKNGYITDGDYYKLPEDKKVAAAFIKGNAALPAEYEDEYIVINYANPVARASECPGTMFCVSSYTLNVDRSMEIIQALQTVASFRNTFQYGVNGVHYTEDEYTGMVNILNDDYAMNPDHTGNLFLLKPNNRMSEEELVLAANNWELAKQQYRDTIISPFAMFNFQIVTAENYKTTSAIYAAQYKEALEAAKAEAKANGEKFDASKFEFDAPYEKEYTNVILDEVIKLSKEYMQKIEDFEEYTDEDGNLVTMKDYLKILRKEFDANSYYKMLIDSTNPDSPFSQYNTWYTDNGPQAEM